MKQQEQANRSGMDGGTSVGLRVLRKACAKGELRVLLERYIEQCRSTEEVAGKGRSGGRFPNVAGFCRSRRIGLSELEVLARDYPKEVDLLFTVLEDEALNAGLPPPILSAYLKKRLTYEREGKEPAADRTSPVICFEHDVYQDGG